MSGSEDRFSEKFTKWATRGVLDADPRARTTARKCIVDTMSCMVLGRFERQSKAAEATMRFGGSVGLVTPIGGGQKMTVSGASMVNGTRGHALDFDDYEAPGSTHPSASILGAIFSVEQVNPMTIDEMCDAWIVGYEAVCWIGTALGYDHYNRGWHASSTLGPIGTAAAVCRALGMSQAQMANAMALAASSSSGMKAQFGTDAKALHVGLAAQNGVFAALLAQSDTKGNIDIWDAKQGFLDLFGSVNSRGFRQATQQAELGTATSKFPVSRKLWPSCSYTHRVIWAAQQIHKQIDSAEQIERIEVRMPEPFYRVASFVAPTNDAEARFSVSYCTAVALQNGHVAPEDFRSQCFSDPARVHLSNRVELDLYDLPDGYQGDIGPSTPEQVSVVLKSGERLTQVVGEIPGGTEQPMTTNQLLRKTEDCGCSPEIANMFLQADGDAPVRNMRLLTQIGSEKESFS